MNGHKCRCSIKQKSIVVSSDMTPQKRSNGLEAMEGSGEDVLTQLGTIVICAII